MTTATADCVIQLFTPTNGDAMQEAITERELNEYLKIAKEASKKGIDALSIVEVEGGKFNLVLDLTYKGKGIVLHTARKEPRGWPKLDSLVTYIKSLGFPEAPISMRLLRETNENSPGTADQNP